LSLAYFFIIPLPLGLLGAAKHAQREITSPKAIPLFTPSQHRIVSDGSPATSKSTKRVVHISSGCAPLPPLADVWSGGLIPSLPQHLSYTVHPLAVYSSVASAGHLTRQGPSRTLLWYIQTMAHQWLYQPTTSTAHCQQLTPQSVPANNPSQFRGGVPHGSGVLLSLLLLLFLFYLLTRHLILTGPKTSPPLPSPFDERLFDPTPMTSIRSN